MTVQDASPRHQVGADIGAASKFPDECCLERIGFVAGRLAHIEEFGLHAKHAGDADAGGTAHDGAVVGR